MWLNSGCGRRLARSFPVTSRHERIGVWLRQVFDMHLCRDSWRTWVLGRDVEVRPPLLLGIQLDDKIPGSLCHIRLAHVMALEGMYIAVRGLVGMQRIVHLSESFLQSEFRLQRNPEAEGKAAVNHACAFCAVVRDQGFGFRHGRSEGVLARHEEVSDRVARCHCLDEAVGRGNLP